ncbi:MAG: protein kinase, partial [Marmoricola sp.]
MPTMPFTDTDVVAAFSEMSVDIPNLGAGQQKVAYKANDGTGDVALKVLLHEERDSDDDEIAVDAERFRRELAGMAAISCPHVVQLLRGPELRLIADRSHLWYTEPYMAGGMLRAKLKTGAMAPREVHTLARSLLMAVEAMWNEGRFVHRDIKPENIGYLADGTIVLLDLGIALFSDLSALTESQMSGLAASATPPLNKSCCSVRHRYWPRRLRSAQRLSPRAVAPAEPSWGRLISCRPRRSRGRLRSSLGLAEAGYWAST